MRDEPDDWDDALVSLVTESRGSAASPPSSRSQVPAEAAAQPPPRRRGLGRPSAGSGSSDASVSDGGGQATPGQLVREVVDDYAEGQTDSRISTTLDHSVRRTALHIANDAPLAMKNRKNFAWVVEKASGKYSHDTEAAHERGSRRRRKCDLCGSLCSRGLRRVRCYARRQPDDPPEAAQPRVMKPEVYRCGQRCMLGLLGVPPVPPKLVQTLRKALPEELIKRQFEPKQWVEPLARMPQKQRAAFSEVLHGELARIIRENSGPGAAWRQLAREAAAATGKGAATAEPQGRVEAQSTAASEEAAGGDAALRDVAVRARAAAVNAVESRPYEEEEEGSTPGLAALPSASPTASPAAAVPPSSVAAPHELYADRHPRPPFVLVVPSYGRPERLQTNTLAFLLRQGISQEQIEVWVAPGTAPGQTQSELERYREALRSAWPNVKLKVGVRGIMEQRWHIAKQLPEGTHVVSFDDDVPEVLYKHKAGTGGDTLAQLPPGGLVALVHHAHNLMLQENAYIWGLNASPNPMNMAVDNISRRNGMVNGFMYGYRVRHDESLRSTYCSPTEDVERSCRVFAKDGVVLRYSMYCARTIFKAPDGISLLYFGAAERKAAEEQAIEDISAEFPGLLDVRRAESRRKTQGAMNFRFRSVGMRPLLADGTLKVTAKQATERAAAEAAAGAAAALLAPAQRADLRRRAASQKALLNRAVVLQDRLARAAAEGDEELLAGSADSRGRGGLAKREPTRVPQVLDDILQLATGGEHSLDTLGLAARGAAETEEADELQEEDVPQVPRRAAPAVCPLGHRLQVIALPAYGAAKCGRCGALILGGQKSAHCNSCAYSLCRSCVYRGAGREPPQPSGGGDCQTSPQDDEAMLREVFGTLLATPSAVLTPTLPPLRAPPWAATTGGSNIARIAAEAAALARQESPMTTTFLPDLLVSAMVSPTSGLVPFAPFGDRQPPRLPPSPPVLPVDSGFGWGPLLETAPAVVPGGINVPVVPDAMVPVDFYGGVARTQPWLAAPVPEIPAWSRMLVPPRRPEAALAGGARRLWEVARGSRAAVGAGSVVVVDSDDDGEQGHGGVAAGGRTIAAGLGTSGGCGFRGEDAFRAHSSEPQPGSRLAAAAAAAGVGLGGAMPPAKRRALGALWPAARGPGIAAAGIGAHPDVSE